ncbi:hypothetical protein BGX21_009965 [Mortierella sp. AD011]|nr:hypothetical protein BGX20_010146 [Mortierella sp. AD010]KAF9395351.1 hypothetical protein BGX21_009965 [Mortierella sp. AD011]
MKTVYADDFSVMSKELEVSYGFENCKTMEDKIYLFGLYQGLIKILECDLRELDKAFCENKLPEFIVSEFFNKTRPETAEGISGGS